MKRNEKLTGRSIRIESAQSPGSPMVVRDVKTGRDLFLASEAIMTIDANEGEPLTATVTYVLSSLMDDYTDELRRNGL